MVKTVSIFHGPQPGQKTDRGPNRNRGPKGAMAGHKIILREEAVERQREYDAKHKPAAERLLEEIFEGDSE